MGRINFPWLRPKRIIICVHGLGNKPPAWLLARWWKRSIHQGLRRSGGGRFFFRLELAYWADILHPRPQSVLRRERTDPRFINEPYNKSCRGARKKKALAWKLKLLHVLEALADALLLKKRRLIRLDELSDNLIKKHFKDLDTYYESKFGADGAGISAAICLRLEKTLSRYRNRRIMLIAHSMGSIIAYDVLRDNPDLEVDTLVTAGSPLGLPYVIKRIIRERGGEYRNGTRLDTPEAVTGSWNNFSDIDDKVAVIYRLASNYRPNARGIGPVDVLVDNDYAWENKANPHKIYGYLRTPELAQVIREFLER